MHALGHVILVAMWLLGLPVAGLADDVITVRVSVKVIRSVDGRLPDGVDLSLLASVIRSDLSLPPPAWWRGYRLVLVDPITPIGGDDPTGPSRWFDVNFSTSPYRHSWRLPRLPSLRPTPGTRARSTSTSTMPPAGMA